MKTLFTLKNLILAACLVSTAYAEHALGTWVGMNTVIACTLPGVLDIYLIHATRRRKDMIPAVLAVMLVNAVSYAVTLPWDSTRSPISIGVSILAPLVLWRLHETEHAVKPQEPVSEPVNEPIYEFTPPHLIAPPAPPEKPSEPPVRMPKKAAMEKAEEGYAYNRSVKDVAAETGYSEQSVYRWYQAFTRDGVKKLVNA